MNAPRPQGRLFLVPTPLDFGCTEQAPITHVLPEASLASAAGIRHWVCENAKTTRAFLKRVGETHPLIAPLPEQTITELPRHVHKKGDHQSGFDGKPLLAGDNERRFFEASWLHKYQGKYYFSYSTGDTHFICYATGDSPYGPFTYQGRILEPVVGWTSHHSICELNGDWYLFYHDSVLSKGVTHLRSVKMAPLQHDAQGRIRTLLPYHD